MIFLLVALFLSQRFLKNTIFIDAALLSILLIFFIGSFYMSYKQILMSKKVDRNMIIGSLVLYLLLGLIWSIFYLLLIMIFPDGFNGLEPISWRENFTRVTYFSFVTLTTLGYGDISPKNSITQFFVYTEAITGVFYMATFVSSIVSARLNHHKAEKL
jgi:voltage-gated potassium channel Kch